MATKQVKGYESTHENLPSFDELDKRYKTKNASNYLADVKKQKDLFLYSFALNHGVPNRRVKAQYQELTKYENIVSLLGNVDNTRGFLSPNLQELKGTQKLRRILFADAEKCGKTFKAILISLSKERDPQIAKQNYRNLILLMIRDKSRCQWFFESNYPQDLLAGNNIEPKENLDLFRKAFIEASVTEDDYIRDKITTKRRLKYLHYSPPVAPNVVKNILAEATDEDSLIRTLHFFARAKDRVDALHASRVLEEAAKESETDPNRSLLAKVLFPPSQQVINRLIKYGHWGNLYTQSQKLDVPVGYSLPTYAKILRLLGSKIVQEVQAAPTSSYLSWYKRLANWFKGLLKTKLKLTGSSEQRYQPLYQHLMTVFTNPERTPEVTKAQRLKMLRDVLASGSAVGRIFTNTVIEKMFNKEDADLGYASLVFANHVLRRNAELLSNGKPHKYQKLNDVLERAKQFQKSVEEQEKAKLAAEAEQQRLAEEQEKVRLAAEAEQQRIADELAAQQRLVEEQEKARLAAEAERQRIADELAGQQRLADEQAGAATTQEGERGDIREDALEKLDQFGNVEGYSPVSSFHPRRMTELRMYRPLVSSLSPHSPPPTSVVFRSPSGMIPNSPPVQYPLSCAVPPLTAIIATPTSPTAIIATPPSATAVIATPPSATAIQATPEEVVISALHATPEESVTEDGQLQTDFVEQTPVTPAASNYRSLLKDEEFTINSLHATPTTPPVLKGGSQARLEQLGAIEVTPTTTPKQEIQHPNSSPATPFMSILPIQSGTPKINRLSVSRGQLTQSPAVGHCVTAISPPGRIDLTPSEESPKSQRGRHSNLKVSTLSMFNRDIEAASIEGTLPLSPDGERAGGPSSSGESPIFSGSPPSARSY